MKKIAIIVFISLMLIGSVVGCSETEEAVRGADDSVVDEVRGKGDKSSREDDAEPPGDRGGVTSSNKDRESINTLPVEVALLEIQTISDEYRVLGKVYPIQEMTIGVQSSGIVEQMNVIIGDEVELGDTLYSINDDQLQLTSNQQLNSALNTLNTMKTKYEVEMVDYEKVKTLFENGYISVSDFDNAYNDLSTSKSNYDNALQNYNNFNATASYNLSGMTLVSPIQGIVSDISVAVGENSSSNDITIINRDQLRIDTVVAGKVVNDIQVGDAVRISHSEESLIGYVEAVSPVGINGTDSFAVSVVLDDVLELNIGSNVEVYYSVSEAENQYVVPKKSVLTDINGDYIYKIEENHSVKIYIEQGFTNNGMVQVIGELQEGDLVVTNGQNMLTEGQAVEIKESK